MPDPHTSHRQADDYELVRPEEPQPPPPSRRNVGLWVAVAVLLAAAAIAAYIVLRGGSTTPTREAQVGGGAAPRSTPARPLGGVPEALDVPPLDETDPLVRSLVAGLSSHPRVADWLATNGLIRNFAVVVINIAEGSTPAVHLRVFRPSAPLCSRPTRRRPLHRSAQLQQVRRGRRRGRLDRCRRARRAFTRR